MEELKERRVCKAFHKKSRPRAARVACLTNVSCSLLTVPATGSVNHDSIRRPVSAFSEIVDGLWQIYQTFARCKNKVDTDSLKSA